MRILTTLFILTSMITIGCNSGPKSAEEAQTDPATTAETIFYLVQNGNFDALPALIAEEADANSKEIGGLKDFDAVKQDQIKEYFESASLNGDPVIEGDRATVKVNLGHDGTFQETFGMVKKDGKWYLSSSSF